MNVNPYTPNAVLVPIETCLSPYGQTPMSWYCGTGAPIWASRDGCSIPGDVVFFNKTFKLISGVNPEVCTYNLKIKADNQTFIYINGNYVGTTYNNWNFGNTFNITPYLNFTINGGINIIAIQACDDGATGWLSAVICGACL